MKSVSSISKKRNQMTGLEIKRRIGCFFLAASVILGLIFLAGGCRSTKVYIPERSMAGFLPPESAIIGKIDVENNRELFAGIAGGVLGAEETLKPVFDRTANVVFAAEPGEGGVFETFLIVQGNFPRGVTSSLLSGDERWEKKFYGRIPWWEDQSKKVQISVPERGIIFIAPDNIEGMLERYLTPFPAAVNSEVLHEMEVSDLVLYLEDPAESLLGDFPIDPERFPLDSLWFTMLGSGETYYLTGAFLLGTPEEAEKMAVFTKILLVGWIRKNDLGDIGDLKNTLKVEPQGNFVRVSGIPLGREAAERFIFSLLPEPARAGDGPAVYEETAGGGLSAE